MTDDLPDLMAAELALGLLDGDDRADALRRVLAERGFAEDVARWRTHFAAMFAAWPDAMPSEGLAERVAGSVAVRPDMPAAANARAFPWRFATGGMAAIAAVLFGLLIVRPGPVRTVAVPVPVAVAQPAPGPLIVASLDAGSRPIPAVYDPASGALRVAAPPAVDRAKVAELWIIGADGVPHALGLLTEAGTGTALRLDRAAGVRLAPGAVLAISVEPSGGSPTGLPTGPVVAKGALATV